MEIDSDCLQWVSYDNDKSIWYEERFFKSGKTMTYDGKKNNISEKIISLFNHIHHSKDIHNSFGKKICDKNEF